MDIRCVKGHLYEVASESRERTYFVDDRRVSCTCPDFTHRRQEQDRDSPERLCKHLRALNVYLAEQTPLAKATDRAASLTEAELQRFAREKNGTVAGCACLLELAARRVAEQREQELKESVR